MLGDGRDRRYFVQDALLLASGLGLWLVYGFLRADAVTIIANALSLALLGGILFFKIRGPQSSHKVRTPGDPIMPARSS